MLIETTRFGRIEVDGTKLITFRDGLLGFGDLKRYALIQTSPDPVFFWLQSVEEPALAFVVCDPLAFVPDYRAPIKAEELAALTMSDLDDCQVFVIVNKVDGFLTANLQGPIVVGATSLLARQLVLSDRRYTTRHRLMKAQESLASAARLARRVG
jgi:flagellar assembly factor FliW